MLKSLWVIATLFPASLQAAPPLGPSSRIATDSAVTRTGVDGTKLDWSKPTESLIVRFVYQQSENQFATFCSGTMIGPRSVLTAGHCFSDEAAHAVKQGRVFAEMPDPANPGKTKKILVQNSKIKFQGPGEFDLGVANLAEDIGNPNAAYPEIATGPCDKGNRLYSVGFGLTEEGKTSDVPRQYEYRDINTSENFIHGEAVPLAGGSLESGSQVPSKGRICLGDSGGPVFCRSNGKLVITSVNSVISSSDFTNTIRFAFQKIKPETYCAKAEKMSGIRLSNHKKELDQLWEKTGEWTTSTFPVNSKSSKSGKK